MALNDDRENAALERRGIQMPEPTEHHRDERVEAGPILTPFCYAYTAASNQSEIALLKIAGSKEVETSMALPHLLKPGCQEACQSKQTS